MKITVEGQRHLGAVIGSPNYKTEYVDKLIDNWIEELEKLSEVARVEPHLAYTAYVFGFQHKYTFFMRTLPDIELQMRRLDLAIDEFICSLLNKYEFTELERTWFSLPPKMGGLRITIPSQLCQTL